MFASSWPVRIAWGVAYVLFYLAFATSWWMFLLLPIHFVIGPVHGAIINWFAHKYGYRNYELEDTSRNLLPLDVLMMGEGYHNNHHRYPSRANFGSRWFEIDPTFLLVWVLRKARIIQMK